MNIVRVTLGSYDNWGGSYNLPLTKWHEGIKFTKKHWDNGEKTNGMSYYLNDYVSTWIQHEQSVNKLSTSFISNTKNNIIESLVIEKCNNNQFPYISNYDASCKWTKNKWKIKGKNKNDPNVTIVFTKEIWGSIDNETNEMQFINDPIYKVHIDATFYENNPKKDFNFSEHEIVKLLISFFKTK